jgi:hypothetical protein
MRSGIAGSGVERAATLMGSDDRTATVTILIARGGLLPASLRARQRVFELYRPR